MSEQIDFPAFDSLGQSDQARVVTKLLEQQGLRVKRTINSTVSGVGVDLDIEDVNEDDSYAIESDIISAIQRERVEQDEQWGGPDHDDKHDDEDWLNFIVSQVGKTERSDVHSIRARLVKIAALAVAGIESIDRVLVDR